MDERGLPNGDPAKLLRLGPGEGSWIWIATILISLLASLSMVLLPERLAYLALLALVGVPLLALLAVPAWPTALAKVASIISELGWREALWICTFLSGLVFRIRTSEAIETNALDAWALYRLALVGVVGVTLLARAGQRQTSWLGTLPRGLIGALTSVCALNLISTLWSVFPAWTLYKSVELSVDVALVAAIVTSVKTKADVKKLFDLTWLLVGGLVISFYVGALIWPDAAIKRNVGLLGIQLGGVMPAVSANSVGEFGAVLGIVAATRLIFGSRGKAFYTVVFVVSLATLILSQSRSPLTGFLVGILLVLLATRHVGILGLIGLGVVAALSLSRVGNLFWQFFLRGQTTTRFYSLTGRVNWWRFGIKQLAGRYFTGYGAYCARFAVLAALGVAEGSSIHSTWVEVLLGVGVVGVALLFATIAGVWGTLFRFLTRPEARGLWRQLAVESVGVLSVLSVRSVFTSAFVWHPPIVFMLVIAYAEFLRRHGEEIANASRVSPQLLPAVRR